MIRIGRSVGSACKFPGSGGAVVGMCNEDLISKLRHAFESRGYVFVRLEPFAPTQEDRVSRVHVRASAVNAQSLPNIPVRLLVAAHTHVHQGMLLSTDTVLLASVALHVPSACSHVHLRVACPS
jgi:hypothetical protein